MYQQIPSDDYPQSSNIQPGVVTNQNDQLYPQFSYPQPNPQYFPIFPSNSQYVQQPMQQLSDNVKPMQSTTTQYEKTEQPSYQNYQTNVILPNQILPNPNLNVGSSSSTDQNFGFSTIERAANEWLRNRLEIIRMLEELIHSLDKKQRNTAKAKVTGTVTNIVGASLIIGGIVGAPFTMGASLIASGAGVGFVGIGTTTTVVASVVEWKHAKKTAKKIQKLLENDTLSMNEMIRKIYEHRLTDPYIDSRIMSISNRNVSVVQFVDALTNHKHQHLNENGGMTNGHTGIMSLTGLLIKGSIPIIAIPVDLVLLVDESKKANGKVPSKLAAKLAPIVKSIKTQTNKASGCVSNITINQ